MGSDGVRAERIRVEGIVQGVGFRPFVYRLAVRHGLHGWVRNSTAGVEVFAQGDPVALDAFVHALQREAPPLAEVRAVHRQEAPPAVGNGGFRIVASERTEGRTWAPPDAATCPDCLRELFDPADRRYRYPFINCTHCGPRFSIIRRLPYDRPHTTMARFRMCAACEAEYHDPADRRFHAQPNACPECGPQVRLEVPAKLRRRVAAVQADDVARAAALLRQGAILAIKGLGGFHLACDATDGKAVSRLRERKARPHKPFAVMMRDLAMARRYCEVSEEAAALLASPKAPIVLLPWRREAGLPESLAPGLDMLGVMLPYTPLHHLLLHDAGVPLVMTSGNREGEPMARTHAEARAALVPLVDGFLWHDRPIHNRVDDGVWAVTAIGAFPLRRSRGDAPRPVRIGFASPQPVLAVGSEMKNTFCLLVGDQAFLSQHIGEMQHAATWRFFVESVRRFEALFAARPAVVAHDLHPGFTLAATEALAEVPGATDAARVGVQHHHAHLASLLAEHRHPGPALGLTFDGTGYGPDGTVWGGEVLLAEGANYRRLASLRLFRLPGSETAIRHPLRIAVALLGQVGESRLPHLPALAKADPAVLRVARWQAAHGLNAPLTSSCGRLFDAVAALLGLVDEVTYEGQAAMLLEAAARPAWPPDPHPYPVVWEKTGETGPFAPRLRLDWRPMLARLVDDIGQGVAVGAVAARFHAWLVDALEAVAVRLSGETGVRTVGLSGGCFVNQLLLEALVPRLRARGLEVLIHRQVPPTDGGLSLGQAWVAARRLLAGVARPR